MKAKTLMIGIVLMFVFFIGVGLFGDHTEYQASKEAPVTPAPEPVKTTQEKIQESIKKDDTWYSLLDSCEVRYLPDTRALMVDMVKVDTWDEASYREMMEYNTMEILAIANTYSADIDNVFITGYTDMVDTQGNVASTKVFFVEAPMSQSVNVNWKNLEGSNDMSQAIANNVAAIWWHPGIRG